MYHGTESLCAIKETKQVNSKTWISGLLIEIEVWFFLWRFFWLWIFCPSIWRLGYKRHKCIYQIFMLIRFRDFFIIYSKSLLFSLFFFFFKHLLNYRCWHHCLLLKGIPSRLRLYQLERIIMQHVDLKSICALIGWIPTRKLTHHRCQNELHKTLFALSNKEFHGKERIVPMYKWSLKINVYVTYAGKYDAVGISGFNSFNVN